MTIAEKDTREAIDEGFRSAARYGDLHQFKALEASFPAQLEALRDRDLLDIAATGKHADLILYLTMHHHFEVSPDFEKTLKQYGGDLFAEGVNEYAQTLEVVANTAIGFTRDAGRSLACHDLMGHFQSKPEMRKETIHTEFYRASLNGDLETFLTRYAKDERYHYCQNRHTGNMVSVLTRELPTIQEEASAKLVPIMGVTTEGRSL